MGGHHIEVIVVIGVSRRPSIPRRFRVRKASAGRPLLWVSGVLACATVLFTVVLIAGRLLSHDAVALEIAAPERDPFYQQKLDARMEELPAQF